MKAKKILGTYNKETQKAIELSFDWNNREFIKIWFPKSQLKFDYKKDGDCELQIPYWLLNAKIKEYNIKIEDSIPVSNVLANFINRTGGDVYCNA